MFKKIILNQHFCPKWYSIAINPLYIIRDGLFKSISNLSSYINGNTLDFGCGNKPYEFIFTNVTNYIGLDIERDNYIKEGFADFLYDGTRIPFPDNYFDSVVAFEVLEHVFNIEIILPEIRRVLKPEGKFLITIPFAWCEHETPNDFARYTSFGIVSILNRYGFEVSHHVKTNSDILTIFQLLIVYLIGSVLPEGRILGKFLQLVVIFPITLIGLISNLLLPKKGDLYCNNVVLSKNCK